MKLLKRDSGYDSNYPFMYDRLVLYSKDQLEWMAH